MFSPETKDKIKELSILASDRQEEACGFVLRSGNVIECLNESENKAEGFAISPGKYGIEKDAIAAVWHSHWQDSDPAYLSFGDLEASRGFGMSPDKFPYLLYHVAFDDWDYYDPMSPNPFPFSPFAPKPSKYAESDDPSDWRFYVGMPFVWGRSDCFGLIRHYFLGVKGVDIGDFRRPSVTEQKDFPPSDWVSPWDATKHGFKELKGEEIQQHDIVEIAQSGGKESNHIAVVVDVPGLVILHSPGIRANNISTLEFYGNHWKYRTIKHLRHESSF